MLRIDKAILDTSGVICDNIARFGATERGLLSQNILGHIRNFVEYVAIKAFSNGADVNPNIILALTAGCFSLENCGSIWLKLTPPAVSVWTS